jgi:hypothetical protein
MSDANLLTPGSAQATSATPSRTPAPRRGGRRRVAVAKVVFVVPAALAINALFG